MTTLPPEDPNAPVGGATPPPTPAAPQQPAAPQPPVGHQPPPAAPQAQQQQAPQQGYAQPGYAQQPPAGGYQQPGYGAQPVADPVTNITLNYWLSVFFTWIPALIFFLIEKDKGNQQAYAYHRDNLNFSLVRTITYAAIVVLTWIPYIGILLAILLWIAQVVLFVFHIMAAAKAPAAFRAGQPAPFIFNFAMVK